MTQSWVMDTSVFNKFFESGRADLLEALAPGNIILVPDTSYFEILAGERAAPSLPDPALVPWVRVVVLDDRDDRLQGFIKADMHTPGRLDMGECAAIAYAKNHGHLVLLDDRLARVQAKARGVPFKTTEGVLIEACRRIKQVDAALLDEIHTDLKRTGMRLPDRGPSFAAWAFQEGRVEWEHLHPSA